MSFMLKLIGACVLLPVLLGVGAVADFVLNDGQLLYALMGRDRLVAACLPELKQRLSDRGYSPVDLKVDPHPSISVGLGRPKAFGAGFTFQDGAAETRIDGVLACVVGKDDVRVQFRTSAKPIRTGWRSPEGHLGSA